MLNFHIYPTDTLRKDQAKDAQGLAHQASVEGERLRDEIHHLTIITQAMWELLKTKTGATDEELKKKITEVEFEKAKAYTTSTLKCKSCSRTVSIKSKTCVFCGEKIEHKEIFPV
ncbi:MAG TPA: hypothetical protein DET40_13140 [Lentisphaeria bacterium]|nr:MAG: hypothetical protein A2X45_17450 [Lentisphaerae bacterium GWF2_50_93]HCE44487.1 hypothetical protein [Lentisphaeria bacterium]